MNYDARIVADCLINPENDVPEQFSELINSINKWGSPGVRKQRLPFFKQQQHTARSSSG